MTARLPLDKIIIASLLGLSAVFITTVVFAQEKSEVASSTIGIQVSSPTYTFTIDPGGVAQEIIKVKNVSETKQTFYPEVLDFKALDESGTPSFIAPDKSKEYTYSLASWVTISKDPIEVAPNETVALSFTINVPKDAEPGGRYAGVLFGTRPPKADPGEVSISNKVGSIILMKVNGDVNETATVKEFSTDSDFYDKGPVKFTTRIQNGGNIHVIPKGTIEIKNLFGQKVETLTVNELGGNVLPESVRKFTNKWEPEGFTMGYYTASLVLNYGNPAKTLTSEVNFWIVPWMQLLVIGLAIVILILVLILAIKRYNKWIVSRATKNPPAGS